MVGESCGALASSANARHQPQLAQPAGGCMPKLGTTLGHQVGCSYGLC